MERIKLCPKCQFKKCKETHRECNSCRVKTWTANNKLRYRANQKAWVLKNLDKFKKTQEKYINSTKGKDKLISRTQKLENKKKARLRARNYALQNKEAYRKTQRICQAFRRENIKACKLSKLFKAQINKIYNQCPENMEVDHIIPLKNNLVSGLHVPWNLQYLNRSANAQKSNSFDGTYLNEGWKK